MLRIKEILKDKGVTQKDLAERINKSESSLHKILNGNPKLSTLQEIAAALNVEVKDLFNSNKKNEISGYIEFNGEIKKI